MRSATLRVRARKARATTSFRPRPAALEDRVLLATYGVPGDVLTYHNDNASTGQNLSETTLTPSNVNPVSFDRPVEFGARGGRHPPKPRQHRGRGRGPGVLPRDPEVTHECLARARHLVVGLRVAPCAPRMRVAPA